MKQLRSISLMMVAVALLTFSAPVNASQMDSRIELSFTTFPSGDDIKIESVNGVVSLTGVVSEESYKSLFQETVAGLSGVKSVDNRLEIKGERHAINSDAWLTMKVKATLLFHRSVSAGTTKIDIKDGIVTMRGIAASQAQKDLTTEYASDINGVKEVKNRMTIETSE
jgi:hyperosmotically inducible protein